jgi:hypothetical protein
MCERVHLRNRAGSSPGGELGQRHVEAGTCPRRRGPRRSRPAPGCGGSRPPGSARSGRRAARRGGSAGRTTASCARGPRRERGPPRRAASPARGRAPRRSAPGRTVDEVVERADLERRDGESVVGGGEDDLGGMPQAPRDSSPESSGRRTSRNSRSGSSSSPSRARTCRRPPRPRISIHGVRRRGTSRRLSARRAPPSSAISARTAAGHAPSPAASSRHLEHDAQAARRSGLSNARRARPSYSAATAHAEQPQAHPGAVGDRVGAGSRTVRRGPRAAGFRSRVARTARRPRPPARGATAWTIAFSTSGWSAKGGTSTAERPRRRASRVTRSRSPNRILSRSR